MRNLRRQGYKKLSSSPYISGDGKTYYHIYYERFEKPKEEPKYQIVADNIILHYYEKEPTKKNLDFWRSRGFINAKIEKFKG